MAMQSLRLRRALTSLSTLHCSVASPPPPSFPKTLISSSYSPLSSSSELQTIQSSWLMTFAQLQLSRGFTGSRVLLSQKKQYKLYKEGDEITEDTVLFEGCDYNHWLITMDFPKDPKPSPEEMVSTYERTCAQGLGISIEEAKKRMYACSTTTYQGFQAVMTEEESEKFQDVPGVVFVLPDSYIDPANKEYGGDKYENGIITPRPPPVQYSRGRSTRFRDRNPEPRYDRQGGSMPNQQGNPQYSQEGSLQGGGRNYGPPQNYPPQQNYGRSQTYSPQQSYGPPQNYSPQQNYGPPQNYSPQQNYGPPQNHSPRQNYGPPGQAERMPRNNNYAPGGSDAYQANVRGSNYNQGQQGNYYPQDQRGFPQGGQQDYGSPGQRDNRNYSPIHGQGANTGYGQGYPGEGQRFSQLDQRSLQEEHGNHTPVGQTGTDQGRY